VTLPPLSHKGDIPNLMKRSDRPSGIVGITFCQETEFILSSDRSKDCSILASLTIGSERRWIFTVGHTDSNTLNPYSFAVALSSRVPSYLNLK
jgi:hypothetical protein